MSHNPYPRRLNLAVEYCHQVRPITTGHPVIRRVVLVNFETEFLEIGENIESHLFLLPDPHTLHATLKAVAHAGEKS